MKTHRFIKQYARVFIERYQADESAVDELEAFSDLLKQHRPLASFFRSPGFSLQEKEKLIRALPAYATLSSSYGRIVDFILFLDKHKAIHFIEPVVKAARVLLQAKRQKALAEVITAEPVDQSVIEQIRKTLEQVVNPHVQIQTTVDASILGGFIIKTGSIIYDTSLKGQLRLLKGTLMNSSV